MEDNTKKSMPFGPHLMLEAYGCDPEVLDNANKLYAMLDNLPTMLNMHKMIKPYIVSTEGNTKKDPGGWSGFVLIEESHISFHTFVKRKFVTVDIYSCKDFDIAVAVDYFKKLFKTEDVEYTVEMRGKRYPQENIE